MQTNGSLLRPQPEYDQEPRWPPLSALPRKAIWAVSQIILFMSLFQVYKMVRKTYITRAEKVAYDNAIDILNVQGKLGLNFEMDWQRWVLDQGNLIKFFNNAYAYYMWGFYACAIILMIMSPPRYQYLRRAFITTMIVALPWYIIYPLAPPRFMEPYGWPFVDTLAVYGPNYFNDSGLVTANKFAAMPSMHCGWTMVAGLMISAAMPWRWLGRFLFVFLTLLIATTVIVTGNHYWLDVVGGWAVVGISLLINRFLPFPLPIRWPWQDRPQVAQAPAVGD